MRALPKRPFTCAVSSSELQMLTWNRRLTEFKQVSALFSDKRLYCIAASEKLSFAVATCLEKKLSELRKADQCKEDFQLVILCSDQQHYIASLFQEVQGICTLLFFLQVPCLTGEIYFVAVAGHT